MNNKKIINLCSIKAESSIRETLKAIERGTIGIAFIIDKNSKLLGVTTDGDIRRALLRGRQLSDKIGLIANKKFIFVRKEDSSQKALSRISSVIKIVPIIDKDGKLVDFIKYDQNIKIPITSPDLKGNELKYLTDAFLSTWISSTGGYIDRFEKEFAEFCSCKYGVAVSSGTTALHLAMTALGIGEGDEVIIPDFTFAACANTVLHTGASPVLVDIEKDYWTIDPAEIKKAITSKTKAIMPVHIYGQPCNMESIMKIAKDNNLHVIEDCAEAHGAEFDGKKVGSFGEIGCFSFFANKILTTGEGGMCVTNSKELHDKMKVLRDHGMSKEKKYWHDKVGFNYRTTNLQAAIGCAQLEKIKKTIKKRSNLENSYRKLFKDSKFIEFQKQNPRRKKITWLVSILIKNGKRDQYIKKSMTSNVDTRPFFYSLGSMPIYKKYLFSNTNSLNISKSGMNLPTQINLGTFEINKIRRILGNE